MGTGTCSAHTLTRWRALVCPACPIQASNEREVLNTAEKTNDHGVELGAEVEILQLVLLLSIVILYI